MMARWIFAFSILSMGLVTVGCGNELDKFVGDVAVPPTPNDTPSGLERQPMSLKLTPGKMNGTASGMAVQGTLSATNQNFALGSDKALVLTISRNRVATQ